MNSQIRCTDDGRCDRRHNVTLMKKNYSHIHIKNVTAFYSIAFRSIAFSLTRSDISAGNSLSVPQYTAVPLFYTDWCLLFSVFLLFTANKWWWRWLSYRHTQYLQQPTDTFSLLVSSFIAHFCSPWQRRYRRHLQRMTNTAVEASWPRAVFSSLCYIK